MTLLYLADRNTASFEQARTAVDVVCAGDSLTGWNNFGLLGWQSNTYPHFLQELCIPLGFKVANCGIAGEVSENGIGQVNEYLGMFPNARHFVIGFGTNDFARWSDWTEASRHIIANLGQMVQAVRGHRRQPLLINVPNANETFLPPKVAKGLRLIRDYHNLHLWKLCEEQGVPLADICSRLRNEHFADELHPNDLGARIIAEEVYAVLTQTLDGEGGK